MHRETHSTHDLALHSNCTGFQSLSMPDLPSLTKCIIATVNMQDPEETWLVPAPKRDMV